MATVLDFREAIERLNVDYPRPGFRLFVDEPPYDVRTQFASQYPNCESSGIYALVEKNGIDILYIGKAQNLGQRLYQYFRAEHNKPACGVAISSKYSGVRYVLTVPLPPGRAFEAPSIEEYLLTRLRPPLNVRLGLMDE